MCGFCGFTGLVTNTDAEKIIENMMKTIVHRGPDSEGRYIDEFGRFNCGFRRLSFIDLTEGHQPIFNEDRSILVFMNGEIYNYKTLRAELEKDGHVFSTNSDTETLVHLYEKYGEEMTSHLRGMFAFVIFNKTTGEFFGARDFFGIKPFYYSKIGDNLLFGSEIKSFLPFPGFVKEVNGKALAHYLSFQYSVLDETFFKGVYKLAPGHSLSYKDGALTVKRYCEHSFLPVENAVIENVVDEIDSVVTESVEAHQISDVEVGSFLSSGVDSSFVAATAGKVKTFTVGFDYDKYNEISYAKDLSARLNVENYSKTITTDEYWDVLPTIQYHMDEPLADPSAVALYFVSQTASKHVKAALSGEGADEFFGGYNIYKEPLDLKKLTDLPMFLRKALGFLAFLFPFRIKGKSFFIRGSKNIERRFIGNANIFSKKERDAILKNNTDELSPEHLTKKFFDEAVGCDDITKMQYLDINMWMPGDILLKADKMSMAHSLEVRVPFLDKEVFNVARKIPTKFRTNKMATKFAFRLAALRHLPELTANKKKLGFPVPIRIWLREEKYYNRVKDAFNSESAAKFFNCENLTKLLDRHKKGRGDFSRKIWTVYTFLIWYDKFWG